jgi:hypothetical protein
MANIPDNPDARLTRAAVAKALTEFGLPTAKGTLATMASRGGGPPFRKYGRMPIYAWGTTLAWAEARLSAPRCSTSEADA